MNNSSLIAQKYPDYKETNRKKMHENSKNVA